MRFAYDPRRDCAIHNECMRAEYTSQRKNFGNQALTFRSSRWYLESFAYLDELQDMAELSTV